MEERISITPIRLEHIEPMQKLIAQEDICVPLSFDYPFPSNGAETYIRYRIDGFNSQWSFTFAILYNQRFIGGCSLHTFSPDKRQAEVAFWLGKPYWGFGYARRAVGMLIQFGFGHCRLESILARTLESNENSIALSRRLGFIFKEIKRQYRPTWPIETKVHLYELTRQLWDERCCNGNARASSVYRKGKSSCIHPFDWVAAPLREASSYIERMMFGCRACYLHGRLVLLLAARAEPWKGLLVPTDLTQHAVLQREFPALEPHPVWGKWLYLPESTDDFHGIATTLVERIAVNDLRFGIVPPKENHAPSANRR